MALFDHQEKPQPSTRPVAIWLYVVAFLVFAMVVLGGVTRLTGSGLSMVEWKPLLGWLPPLSDADWQELFRKYKQHPEFRKVHPGMSLAGFKGIFWLEYLHRVFGRLIGLVYLIPFLIFLRGRRIPKPMIPRLIGLFVLGALQGVLGWYMVQSGLVDRPDVSHYRLAAHLVLAVAIFGYALHLAFVLTRVRPEETVYPDYRGLRNYVRFLIFMIVLTMVSGALVAGLDAGKIYNTFPMMGDRIMPPDMFKQKPVYMNFLENRSAVQFDHRVLAVLTGLLIIFYWLRSLRAVVPGRVRLASFLFLVVTLAQIGLGIGTLLLFVPLPLAAGHQTVAMLLLTAALYTLHHLRTRVYAGSQRTIINSLPEKWRSMSPAG